MSKPRYTPEIGDVVTRGPDWMWRDQDGGEGNTGVVLKFSRTPGWVRVRWTKNNYVDGYRYRTHQDLQPAFTLSDEEIWE